MGKRIVAQRRGRGSMRYRSLSHRYKGKAKHVKLDKEVLQGKVLDLVHCPGHNAPLADVIYSNGVRGYMIASEKMAVGSGVFVNSSIDNGCVLRLGDVPEGTLIYNIEKMPGDGGKFVRSSGTFARVVGKDKGKVIVKMPSKKNKIFLETCRACVGVVAGGGRKEKPFVKAGKRYHAMRARGRLYPITSGVAMNATDHPFGSGRGRHMGKVSIAPKHAPPGRKVGQVAARRTGKKK